MTQKALKESEEKQLILATFPMANEGLDIISLNTLILASPKSDIIQSVGRIMRQKHETIIPQIIDIVDDFSVFGNQSIKRLKLYKKRDYAIENIYYNLDENIIIKKEICEYDNNIKNTINNIDNKIFKTKRMFTSKR